MLNKLNRWPGVLLIMCLALLVVPACERLSVYTRTADLTFPDAALEQCVQHTGETRQWPEAGRFLELRCNNALGGRVRSLEGISALVELESLDMSFNQIEDASPVLSLPRLVSLYLGHNRVVEIFDGSRSSVRSSIRSLNLDYNKISGLAWLANFGELRSLTLSHNQVTSVEELGSLSRLKILDLSGNTISDISPLAGLRELRVLSLAQNDISDVEALAGLSALEVLNLSRNQLSNIAAIGSLVKLVELDLSENPISDLSPLAKLINLEKVTLDNTEPASLVPLLTLGRLEQISLRGAAASDCNEVEKLVEVFGPDAVITNRACSG